MLIQINTSSDGWLTVSNTHQRKSVNHVNSTRKGLLNILDKYQLLGQDAREVEETARTFTVTLPLVSPVS